jgi:heme exporter protein CcmD
MAHFLFMGGYAAFVWPSYGLSVLAIAALIYATLSDASRTRRRLAELSRDTDGDT